MAVFTQDQVESYAGKVLDEFEGGFHVTKIPDIVKMCMEIVEQVQGMTGDEKKQSVISLLDYVIDNTDIPWVPDALVDPILKQLVPGFVDVIVAATKDKLSVNITNPAAPSPPLAPATKPDAQPSN